MPLRLDIKRKLLARSDRVKAVDLHPSEPWMIASLYNGHVHIWNYDNQQLVKTFEVCELPVRSVRFCARKNWAICGSDDMHVRVYNYNTLERVHQFEAHSDYLRALAVHPQQPYLLTSSDDMSVKLWDWDNKWACKQVFEGHTHYVMQIAINPKDNNTFASASLDRTIKVWQFGSAAPNFTLEGHEKGVNCVDYYHGGDKPYLISGADDRTVRIWDYQNKTCVITLEGHAQNVIAVCFHPELPIIITGSEDSTVRIWHATTYRLETTLNYGLERVWCIRAQKGTNTLAIGYDEGSVLLKVGREEPAASMDAGGKIIWARHAEMQQANLKSLGAAADDTADGERLPLSIKDMGACEIYPQTVAHNPKGTFVVVCGDGEYIIYTAMALRNKAYGSALEFVWAADSNMYATRESPTLVRVYKAFKEHKVLKPDAHAEQIYGGALLGVRSAHSIAFYEWDTLRLVRRIEIGAKQVHWSEAGNMLAVTTEDAFYVLKYDADCAANATEEKISEDGIEDCMEPMGECGESVRTGRWLGDCFVFTTAANRLYYYVGGELVTVAHPDRPLYLLGYISKDSRLVLIDKDYNVVSYELLLAVLQYQTAVMRGDFDSADTILPTIPKEQRARVAHFLEKQGFRKQALAVTTDAEHKFELALALGELQVAKSLAQVADSEEKWRLLSAAAAARSELPLAGECLGRAKDYAGLLMLATAAGSHRLLTKLHVESTGSKVNNVSWTSAFLLGQTDQCVDILIETGRLAEAAFFARTYCPSQIPRVLELWKQKSSNLAGGRVANSLADPEKYENLFGGMSDALKAEQYLKYLARQPIPASAYVQVPNIAQRNVLQEMSEAEASGALKFDDDGTLVQLGVPQQMQQQHVPQQEAPPPPVEDDLCQPDVTGGLHAEKRTQALHVPEPKPARSHDSSLCGSPPSAEDMAASAAAGVARGMSGAPEDIPPDGGHVGHHEPDQFADAPPPPAPSHQLGENSIGLEPDIVGTGRGRPDLVPSGGGAPDLARDADAAARDNDSDGFDWDDDDADFEEPEPEPDDPNSAQSNNINLDDLHLEDED